MKPDALGGGGIVEEGGCVEEGDRFEWVDRGEGDFETANVLRISNFTFLNVLNVEFRFFFINLLGIFSCINGCIKEDFESFVGTDNSEGGLSFEQVTDVLSKFNEIRELVDEFTSKTKDFLENSCKDFELRSTSPNITKGLVIGVRFHVHELKNALAVLSGGVDLSLSILDQNCDCCCGAECRNELRSFYSTYLVKGKAYTNRLFKGLQYLFSSGPGVNRNLSFVSTDNLCEMKSSLMGLIKLLYAKNYDIEDEIEPGISIDMNFDKFDSLMFELFRNAYEAMPDGGKVTRRISRIIDEKDNGKSWCVIEFSDTGCGMSENDRSKIFDDGFTTKSKGTGIGLKMVKEYVDEVGGDIVVDTSLGDGTTFKIFLPVKADVD